MRLNTFLAGALCLGAHTLFAGPFVVTPTTNANQLASLLLGPGVTIVGTPVYSGQPGQAGVFTEFTSGTIYQSDYRGHGHGCDPIGDHSEHWECG
jgi:hypothetical protein